MPAVPVRAADPGAAGGRMPCPTWLFRSAQGHARPTEARSLSTPWNARGNGLRGRAEQISPARSRAAMPNTGLCRVGGHSTRESRIPRLGTEPAQAGNTEPHLA